MIVVMAKSSSFLQLLALVFIWMLVNAPHGGALTCSDVNNDLLPCLGYITGGGSVPSTCCSGVKTLIGRAKTKADRQTACNCIKALIGRATDPQLQRAQTIPKTCGVSIPFTISRKVDCSKAN